MRKIGMRRLTEGKVRGGEDKREKLKTADETGWRC